MISVLLPTRDRPESFKRAIQSGLDTTVGVNSRIPVEFCCYVDSDDEKTINALGWDVDLIRWQRNKIVRVIVGPRILMSKYWNKCAGIARGDIVMLGSDDSTFNTFGWDGMVEEEFAKFKDRILVVHGNDGSGKTKDFGPHPFVSREWVDTLGYFTPPYFSSDWADTWPNDLASALGGRRELPFTIEHFHILFGKAELDQNTIDRLKNHYRDDTNRIYRCLTPLRDLDIEKLRRKINGSTVPTKWAILILSQPSRAGFLQRILTTLKEQTISHPDVDVKLRFFDRNMTLGENRQAMIAECDAEYVNFVDDDDLISDRYVEAIYPLLDGVDYIGFRLQGYIDGTIQKPTIHSLQQGAWHDDGAGYYRDFSHLNPIRREFYKKVPLEGGFGEDARWAERMRREGRVRTEHFIDDVMYKYFFRTQKSDVSWA